MSHHAVQKSTTFEVENVEPCSTKIHASPVQNVTRPSTKIHASPVQNVRLRVTFALVNEYGSPQCFQLIYCTWYVVSGVIDVPDGRAYCL
jgi:hypothetical protein